MQEADQFLIPLLDGQHALAQIARIEKDRALLFVARTKAGVGTPVAPIPADQIIAVFCADLAVLPTDLWPVIGYDAVPRLTPYHDKGLEFLDLTDPNLIEAFANAVHGLYPWDGFPDADLFTNMLRDPETLPPLARMAADFPTEVATGD